MKVLKGSRRLVDALEFTPDGRSLAVPCAAGVQVWDVASPATAPRTFEPAFATGLQFSPDGHKALVYGYPTAILTLDSGTIEEVPLDWPDCPVRFADLCPGGRRFTVVQSRPPTLIGDSEQASLLTCRQLDAPRKKCWSVGSLDQIDSRPLFLAGDEKFLTLESRFREAKRSTCPVLFVVRDAQTGGVVSEVVAPPDCPLSSQPTLSADRRQLAAFQKARIGVYRVAELTNPVIIRNDSRQDFTGIAFHPSGHYLAATSNDNTVKLYDTNTWQMAHAFDWQVGRLRSIAFSPDGMLAAAGGDRGKIVVWDFDL